MKRRIIDDRNISCRRMNEKGFTLFTALVSFLLIILSALLVNSMINTERDIRDTVGEVRMQMEMESVADLARGDSLQFFNYALRFSIEDWLIGNSQRIFAPDYDWDEITDGFASRNFGGCVAADPNCRSRAFAVRVAAHLLAILEPKTGFGSYDLRTRTTNKAEFENIVEKMMFESATSGDFFDVYRCDATTNFDNCVGTFYVNLDTSGLTSAEFEKLPMMTVSNSSTGRSIEKPVLQQGSFQIYVPLRLFKAFKGAHLIAHGNGNTGIFTDNFRNGTLKPQALGADDAAVKNAIRQLLKPRIDDLIGTYHLDSGVDFYVDPNYQITLTTEDSGGQKKLRNVSVELTFIEKNTNYTVNNLNGAAQKYIIELVDSRGYP